MSYEFESAVKKNKNNNINKNESVDQTLIFGDSLYARISLESWPLQLYPHIILIGSFFH